MKLKNKIIIILVFVAIIITGKATKVQAKSYYIDDMKIQATVQKNGDLEIEQTLKYNFNGEYNGIYVTIPTKYENKEDIASELSDSMYDAQGVKIEEVSVTDEQNSTYNYKKAQSASNGTYGVYTEERSNNTCKLKVYSPSKDTSKTFKVKYTLQNVCVLHNDVGELYYNFIGGDWQCSIKKLQIDVFIPNNQQDIKIWGHGPDNGISKIIDNTHATFEVQNIATGKYVAARVVFDTSNIKYSNKKSNINALDKILEDEKRISKMSDSKRAFTRNIIILSLVLMFYWVALLIKYEKDKRIKWLEINEDELFKKYNPMIAGCLQGSRDVLARDIIAVILNLIDKKNIKLEVRSTNSKSAYAYVVSKNPEKEEKMDKIEKMVYDWLFKNKAELDLASRLKRMSEENDAQERFKNLNDEVQKELNEIGANQKGVPVFVRVFNTFLFFITVYIAIKHVLYEGMEIYNAEDWLITAMIFIGAMCPIVLLIVYGILTVIITIRRKVNNLINKITGQRDW